jgi:hypothetical protein
MPKKLVNLPLVEPMKFFALPDASISAEFKSQETVTNRIIQRDRRRSLVARGKTGTSKGEIDQTYPSEHNVVLGARRGERGGSVWISLGGRIYEFKRTAFGKEGGNKLLGGKRWIRRSADATVQVTCIHCGTCQTEAADGVRPHRG